MADKEEQPPESTATSSSSPLNGSAASRRPTTITDPSLSPMDTLIMGPPMTLLPSFFSETDPDFDFQSFAQLFADDTAPPVSVGSAQRINFPAEEAWDDGVPVYAVSNAQRVTFPVDESLDQCMLGDDGSKESGFRFQQNHPSELVTGQSPVLPVDAAFNAQRVTFPADESLDQWMLLEGGSEESGFRFQQNRPSGLIIGESPMLPADAASPAQRVIFPAEESLDEWMSGDGGSEEFGFMFQQNRKSGLVIRQSPMIPVDAVAANAQRVTFPAEESSDEWMFTVPPGPSPSCLFQSPEWFSSDQDPFGMSHHQTAQTHSQMHLQAEYPSSVSAHPAPSFTHLPSQATAVHQQMPVSDPEIMMNKSFEFSYLDQRPQSSTSTGDKHAADDGYNWLRYGKKQLKGSEIYRSYYQCKHPNCPAKKNVDHSQDGHVTKINYNFYHNHDPPRGGTTYLDEPNPKRRVLDVSDKIILQVTSEDDLLDDGYKWRKYGQKINKGNTNPRSYFKCTTPGCNVRKQVERTGSDSKSVQISYDGRHNHERPAVRNHSSHNTANSNASQLNPDELVAVTHTNMGNNDQHPNDVFLELSPGNWKTTETGDK